MARTHGGNLRAFEIGVVLTAWRSSQDPTTVPWADIRDLTVRAEAMGFDAVWSPDELLGRLVKDGPRYGFWDGFAIPAAMAAVTSRIEIGTWVASSTPSQPGDPRQGGRQIDDISGGRFVLGSARATPRAASMRSACPWITSTTTSRRRWRSSSRCCAPVAPTTRGRITWLVTWSNCHRARGRAISRCCLRRMGSAATDTPPGWPTSGVATPRSAATSMSWAPGHRVRGRMRRGRARSDERPPLSRSGRRAPRGQGTRGTVRRGPSRAQAEEIADAFRTFRDAGFTQLEFIVRAADGGGARGDGPGAGAPRSGRGLGAQPTLSSSACAWNRLMPLSIRSSRPRIVRSSSTCSSINHCRNCRLRWSLASRAALARASNCAVTLTSFASARVTTARAEFVARGG